MRVAAPAEVAGLLAERLAETGEPSRDLTLAGLLERLLPYPVVRRRLRLAGKVEYDLSLLRLLTEPDLLEVDPALAEAAARELENPEPALAGLGDHADAGVRLRTGAGDPASPHDDAAPGPHAGSLSGAGTGRAAGREAEEGAPPSGREAAPPAPEAGPPAPEAAPAALDPAPDPSPREASDDGHAPRPSSGAAEGARVLEPPPPLPAASSCWSCARALPPRDVVRFCPHCGSDQSQPRCRGCGDRLETGWTYCPRCGRRTESG